MHVQKASAGSRRSMRSSSQLITNCGKCGRTITLSVGHCPERLVRQLAALVVCDRCAAPSAIHSERNAIVRAILPFVRLWKVKASAAIVNSFLALARYGRRSSAATRQAAAEVETVLAGGAQ